MRNPTLTAVAALALASCGGGDGADSGAAAEQNVTTQVVATNDVTAIDAATGAAANMAADVDYMPNEVNSVTGNNAVAASPEPRRSGDSRPSSPTSPTAAEPRATEPAEDEPDINTL